MIADLQLGEIVIAGLIYRVSRLFLDEVERLAGAIQAKSGRLTVPGVVDMSDLAACADETSRIVLEGVQALLLRLGCRLPPTIIRPLVKQWSTNQDCSLAAWYRRQLEQPPDNRSSSALVAFATIL